MPAKTDPPNGQPHRPKRITALDVAELVGVSRSAVSRAFSPGSYLDPAKRELILNAAMQVGYRPNALASSLKGVRSNLIGVIAGDMNNHFDADFLAALVGSLNKAGKWPLVLGGKDVVTDQAILAALSYPLDAMIIRGGSVGSEIVENCGKLSIPVLFAGRAVIGHFADSVACDNRTVMSEVVDLLLKKGRRSFAYLGGPRELSSDSERLSGVAERLSRDGLTLTAKAHADFTIEGGALQARALLSQHKIDALVCANDALAIGALSCARSMLGLSVPSDLSITGFDDMTISSLPEFNLTTAKNPIQKMVAELMRVLEGRLQDPQKPSENTVVESTLVLRGTH